ncbi:DJ-1/PfpI family protein [uncultured Campylobacter sp.]|uniref:DJ-1/PfpI family protein n=1 Tax=uncultured Campylobacter sp. TaxID=218934 RepID=UPI0026082CA9|nr:DJ-1/PfpI family protein [uncultured Campylobacter sp.]
MKNLALVMFSGQTHLDFVGFYDCMLRLKAVRPQLEMRFCSRERQVSDSGGLTIDVGEITTDLGGFDAVFVPGGMATRRLRDDAGFISWLATARDAKYKFSVCTGSLLLGAAGFLRGRRATTHPFCYDLLAPYCADVVHERLVRESLPEGGEIITAGGVSSSIELGLCVIEKFAGASAREAAAAAMDYPYYDLRGKLAR